MDTFLEKHYFYKLQMLGNQANANFGPDLEKRAPGNDEDPSKQFLEIMDVRSISIKTQCEIEIG